MTDLVTYGETMALLSADEIGLLRHATWMRLGIGGAESNVAIGTVRLGATASWSGRVGDDELGRLVATTMRGQGVETTAIVDPIGPTGLMIKERRSSQLARVMYYRSDSAGSRLTVDDIDESAVAAAKVVHLTGITTAISRSAREAVFACMEIARAGGTLVSWDLNYRSALWSPADAAPVLRDAAAKSDIVFATDDEARLLVDGPDATALAAGLARLGAREVLVKRGADGAAALLAGTSYVVPAEQVVAVDHVGAGDAFTAGYLSATCNGLGAGERLRTATLAGAFAVTVAGDWEGLPSLDELETLVAGHPNVAR
jgi:2-dehydro-3-deoxygluconokinase